MVRWLKALTVLPENLVLFLAPVWWLTSVHNYTFRGLDTFFWLPGAPGKHIVHRHAVDNNLKSKNNKVVMARGFNPSTQA